MQKRPLHGGKAHEFPLQRLTHVVRVLELRLGVHYDVYFDVEVFTCVVCAALYW